MELKKCCRCFSIRGLDAFPKDKKTKDGHAGACKVCKMLERKAKRKQELARWKKYYAPGSENRKRHIIRCQTRRKYGSAKEYKCKLCGKRAFEWHHFEYKIDSVIPVCIPCHDIF